MNKNFCRIKNNTNSHAVVVVKTFFAITSVSTLKQQFFPYFHREIFWGKSNGIKKFLIALARDNNQERYIHKTFSYKALKRPYAHSDYIYVSGNLVGHKIYT